MGPHKVEKAPLSSERRGRDLSEDPGPVLFAEVHGHISADWTLAEPIATKRHPVEASLTAFLNFLEVRFDALVSFLAPRVSYQLFELLVAEFRCNHRAIQVCSFWLPWMLWEIPWAILKRWTPAAAMSRVVVVFEAVMPSRWPSRVTYPPEIRSSTYGQCK